MAVLQAACSCCGACSVFLGLVLPHGIPAHNTSPTETQSIAARALRLCCTASPPGSTQVLAAVLHMVLHTVQLAACGNPSGVNV